MSTNTLKPYREGHSFFKFKVAEVNPFYMTNLDTIYQTVQEGISNLQAWSWRKEALLTCSTVFKLSSGSIVQCILKNTINDSTISVRHLSFFNDLFDFLETGKRLTPLRNYIDLFDCTEQAIPTTLTLENNIKERLKKIFGYVDVADEDVVAKWLSVPGGLVDFIETTWIIHTNRNIV